MVRDRRASIAADRAQLIADGGEAPDDLEERFSDEEAKVGGQLPILVHVVREDRNGHEWEGRTLDLDSLPTVTD